MRRIPATPRAFVNYLATARPDPTHLLQVLALYREGLLGPKAVRLARLAYEESLRAPSDREIERAVGQADQSENSSSTEEAERMRVAHRSSVDSSASSSKA